MHHKCEQAKPRSWTFPSYPSPTVGVAPVPFADCQPSFAAFLCLTFLCAADEEAVSLKEEDFCADWGDALEEAVVGAVSEVRYFALKVH